ncbi:MAG TPA: acyl carrier protein [Acidimicrobiales bacterium]|nr:acyl carrier protein [Acidimicrobiales bacterium]
MTDIVALDVIRRTIHEIAPEADLDEVGPDDTLRESLDLDSIDFLNFVVGLHEKTGMDIPERDYSHLFTLAGCVSYLSSAAQA